MSLTDTPPKFRIAIMYVLFSQISKKRTMRLLMMVFTAVVGWVGFSSDYASRNTPRPFTLTSTRPRQSSRSSARASPCRHAPGH